MRSLIAYISGKVTGVENNNEPLFRYWEKKLIEMGYTVIVPHDLDPGVNNPTWHDWMRVCIQAEMNSDLIVTLPDWDRSRGAIDEVGLARRINIPVIPCYIIRPMAEMTWPKDAVFRKMEDA